MSKDHIRIATRRSPLALWQAEYVRHSLAQAHPDLRVEIVGMSTTGDRILDAPLAKVGGKGLFVKELEQAMLERRADIAVHSMKDVPVDLPAGLVLPVICPREDPRDAFVSNRYRELDELPSGSRLGSSSLRRQCQVRERRPDIDVRDLRGNVNTRLAKLDAGAYDAVILATAGLVRLKMADRIRQRIPTEVSLPAIGQGAVGIECREGDSDTRELIDGLGDPATTLLVAAERALNARLGGGCQVPIAGHAVLVGERLELRGLVGRPDGSLVIRGQVSGEPGRAEQLGTELAEDLLSRGAGAILSELV